jgi:hypothetical protein
LKTLPLIRKNVQAEASKASDMLESAQNFTIKPWLTFSSLIEQMRGVDWYLIFLAYLVDIYSSWLTLATSFAIEFLLASLAASFEIAAAWIPPKPIRRNTVVPMIRQGKGKKLESK